MICTLAQSHRLAWRLEPTGANLRASGVYKFQCNEGNANAKITNILVMQLPHYLDVSQCSWQAIYPDNIIKNIIS